MLSRSGGNELLHLRPVMQIGHVVTTDKNSLALDGGRAKLRRCRFAHSATVSLGEESFSGCALAPLPDRFEPPAAIRP